MDKIEALAVINKLSLLENIFKGYMISLKLADLHNSEVALKKNSEDYKKAGVDCEEELFLIKKTLKDLQDDPKRLEGITRSDLLSLNSISSNIGLVCAFLECNQKDNKFLIDKICKIDELIFLRVIYNLVEAWKPYWMAKLEDEGFDYRESIISVDLLCTTIYQFKEIIGRDNKDSDTLFAINHLRGNLEASLREMDEAEEIGEESQSEIDFFDPCLRLQDDLDDGSVVLYDDEDIYREITRFKFYLLEREKEDRSILLESVTNKLLYAYFLRRNKVNKKNPKDRNRHLMLMYEMIITSIITNISWDLKIEYSKEFKKEWEARTDKGITVIYLLTMEMPHPFSANKKQTMPKELDTKEARELFGKTVNLGYCKKDNSLYRWTATGGVFGCFVDCASERLKVRSSNNRIPWSMFEKAFQCEKTTISTAKSAVNSYTMKGLNPPVGYEDIAKICNINFQEKRDRRL
jgi:hypothetical protein